MLVNVFITRRAGRLQNKMLVLPSHPSSTIPLAYRTGWVLFGSFDSSDEMFNGAKLDFHLGAKGYAVLDAEIQDRQKTGR